jgi:hypothetical protein
VLTLLPISSLVKACSLVAQLRDCAEQALSAGPDYDDSRRRLLAAAEAIERKLGELPAP